MGRFSGMEIFSSQGLKNPRDEEIFIPENHGPFGNCIPVRVNQAIFLFQSGFLATYLRYIR